MTERTGSTSTRGFLCWAGPVRCLLSGAAGCSVVIFGIAQIFSFSFVKNGDNFLIIQILTFLECVLVGLHDDGEG